MAWDRSNKVTPRKRILAWAGIVIAVILFGIIPSISNPKFVGYELGTVVNIRPAQSKFQLSQNLQVEIAEKEVVRIINRDAGVPQIGDQICLLKSVRQGLFGSVVYDHAPENKCQF